MVEQEQRSNSELFIHLDEKIRNAEEKVNEFHAHVSNQNQKLDHLTQRIDKGISETVFKTWEKVNEISTSMANLINDNKLRDVRIEDLEEDSKSHRANWNMLISGIIFVVFTSITIGILRYGV